MTDLAATFEEHRHHLRGVAYRMLGSSAEADDAVQEAWLKLSRADTGAVENLRGWLTTVVSRVCLDMLRSRTSRREDPLVAAPETSDAAPAMDRELAESVGLAALVVLDKLDPAERVAFTLHDLFAMPFDEIAKIIGRSPAAARQLASRARRRVHGSTASEVDLVTQRRVVDAFVAALRAGDTEALVAVLDPDVVVRVDGPNASQVRGAREWARGAVAWQRAAQHIRPVIVDGSIALALAPHGAIQRVLLFSYAGATIREAEVVSEPDAVAELVIEELPPGDAGLAVTSTSPAA